MENRAAWLRPSKFFLLEVLEFTFEICFIDTALISKDNDGCLQKCDFVFANELGGFHLIITSLTRK